ncbi:MAG TPA: VOC family protein [Candidatus Binataceae bacterium]|nr:VOC family protein [Candidatus Binataceae bacterium]
MIKNRGMRHIALKVADVGRAKEFYERVFGMKVVWQPDPDNAYLSSGCDNLALHRADSAFPDNQRLDHLGFIVPTIADVESGYEWAKANGLDIVHHLKHHRDGAVSFYIRDPDGNVIQALYEPEIGPMKISREDGSAT